MADTPAASLSRRTMFALPLGLPLIGGAGRALAARGQVVTILVSARITAGATNTFYSHHSLTAAFERNFRPETGLVDSMEKYPASTMWEAGSYLMALISAQRLGHEVRNHAAIVDVQAGTVGIENPHQPRVDLLISPVRRNQRF